MVAEVNINLSDYTGKKKSIETCTLAVAFQKVVYFCTVVDVLFLLNVIT